MNTRILALSIVAALVTVPGLAAAEHAVSPILEVDLSHPGCLRPNVPDCIDLAAALAKWASNFVGETVCDILCDDDGNLLFAIAAN